MNRLLVRIIIAGLLVIGGSGSAAADWKLDIGYTRLQNELGAPPHRGRRQGDPGGSLLWQTGSGQR